MVDQTQPPRGPVEGPPRPDGSRPAPAAAHPRGYDNRPRDVAYAERVGSPGYGESRDPDQLADEIEVLQNRMADRLDRVSSALTPQNMLAQVTGEKNPDIFTTVDTVADAARRNPIAASLIGAGLAALLFNSRKPRYEPDPEMLDRRVDGYGVEGVRADGTRFAAVGERNPETGELRADAARTDAAHNDPLLRDDGSSIERVEGQVRALQDAAAARLDAATTAAAGVYESGRERLRDTYESVRERFRSDEDSPDTMDWVRENQVSIGLAALAAGALAAGYYTASKPTPRRRALPRDRSLMVQDDALTVRDEYVARTEPVSPPMPVSAAAPTPMGAGLTRTAPIGGSGQIDRDDATPASASSPTSSGSSMGSGSSTTPDGKGAARSADRASGTTGFGSTPASRGEPAAKPLATSQSTSAREQTLSDGAKSASLHDAKADGDGSKGEGSSGLIRTLDRGTDGLDSGGSNASRNDDPSDSTVDLTRVYPRN